METSSKEYRGAGHYRVGRGICTLHADSSAHKEGSSQMVEPAGAGPDPLPEDDQSSQDARAWLSCSIAYAMRQIAWLSPSSSTMVGNKHGPD